MENPNDEIVNFDDLPKCHYCERYAFEIHFQGIAVCERCLENMTAHRVWRVVRSEAGDTWVTVSDQIDLTRFQVLGEGTFSEMWELCHKDDPNYG